MTSFVENEASLVSMVTDRHREDGGSYSCSRHTVSFRQWDQILKYNMQYEKFKYRRQKLASS